MALSGFAVFHAAVAATDFACADLKPSGSDKPPYLRVAAQPRCEGFYLRTVSQPFIELVSLTAGVLAAPPAGEPLQVSVSATRAARLVVQPLRPGPFYRVDALIEPAQSLRWDAAPMLAATGLRWRELGFLALAPAAPDDTMTVLPLAAAPATSATPDLQAVLRVSVPVASLAWRRYRPDGSADASAWREIPGPARFAWERVPLAIEMPADGSGLRVDVQALDAAGQALPLLRFLVIGPADASR